MTDLNPVIFDQQVRLTADHFSWHFLRAPENAWAMAHILNPFIIQMIFQNWRKTIIAFLIWEAIEVFALTAFGDYGIFVGDQSDFEPIADSLIGDPFNGFLGLILAFTFTIAFRVPYWNAAYFGQARSVFWKRLILYCFMIWSFLAYNAELHIEGYPRSLFVGVYITIILHVIILSAAWLWWDNTRTEIALFWHGYIHTEHRNKVYLGWMTLLVLFQLGGTYYITYVYYQVWALWGLTMILLILYTAAQGRLQDFPGYAGYFYRSLRYQSHPELQVQEKWFPSEPASARSNRPTLDKIL